jgi:ribokinase
VGREVATPTLLNPAPAEPLPDDAWPLIDIVTPNRSEAAVLMGLAPSDEADPSALALELSRRGAGAAVVTLGRDGAVVAQAGAVAAIPACPVSRVVDTTGAGDAFTGALAVAVAEGMALADAVRFAARAGAHAVTIDEVIPSLATRAELAAAAP